MLKTAVALLLMAHTPPSQFWRDTMARENGTPDTHGSPAMLEEFRHPGYHCTDLDDGTFFCTVDPVQNSDP